MVDQVQIPHSVIEAKVPLPGEVAVAGLAVNLKDYTLYSKGYDGLVFRLNGIQGDDNDTNADVSLVWVKQAGGARQYVSSAKLAFNPHSGMLKATIFNGSFEGNGSGLTGLTSDQVTDALGFTPVEASRQVLPPAATDPASTTALVNSIRSLLIDCGLAS